MATAAMHPIGDDTAGRPKADGMDKRRRLASQTPGIMTASDEWGGRAAAIYSLTVTGKLNDVDPRAWLADVLAKLPDHPAIASPR